MNWRYIWDQITDCIELAAFTAFYICALVGAYTLLKAAGL